MTVDELILELQQLSTEGYGSKVVWAGQMRITGEFGWAPLQHGDVYLERQLDRIEVRPD